MSLYFWPLLKQASSFETAGEIEKICLSQKPNHHNQANKKLSMSKSLTHSVCSYFLFCTLLSVTLCNILSAFLFLSRFISFIWSFYICLILIGFFSLSPSLSFSFSVCQCLLFSSPIPFFCFRQKYSNGIRKDQTGVNCWRVACNLEYEYLENYNLECNLVSKI